jgi:hypothetical protein
MSKVRMMVITVFVLVGAPSTTASRRRCRQPMEDPHGGTPETFRRGPFEAVTDVMMMMMMDVGGPFGTVRAVVIIVVVMQVIMLPFRGRIRRLGLQQQQRLSFVPRRYHLDHPIQFKYFFRVLFIVTRPSLIVGRTTILVSTLFLVPR